MKKLISLLLFFTYLSIYGQSYFIGRTTINFIDASRTGGTSIAGATSFPTGASGRAIGTQIFYPATANGTNAIVASGTFPVVVFGHGFAMTYDAYTTLADSLAAIGYIVALPTTEGSLFTPSHLDLGKDLGFIAAQMIGMNTTAGAFFYQHISGRIGIGGHSMGGGATFLSDAYCTDSVRCCFTFGAAETNPSAIAAASNITRPYLVFSGTYDCVAPTATNQTPMYDSLHSTCKTHINITKAYHCEFADNNFNCGFGEGTCITAGGLSSTTQQAIVRMYLEPYLDYYLKGICPAWTHFQNLIDTATIAAVDQVCNNTIPGNPIVTGNSFYCDNGATALTAMPAGFAYNWNTGSTTDTILVSQPGDYSFTVSNSTCALVSPLLHVIQQSTPAAPSSITGADTVCSGISNLSYFVTSDTNATYIWHVPAGWAITNATDSNTIIALSGNTGGAIYVSAQNGCGVSDSSTKDIVVVPSNLGNAGPLTADSILCYGDTIALSVDTVTGAASYNWTYPITWQALSVLNSNAISFITNSSGPVTVAAVNGCGLSIPSLLNVQVNTVPLLTYIEGPDTFCMAQDPAPLTFNTNGLNNVIYDWIAPNGWSALGNSNDSSVTFNTTTSGNIYVTASNGCGTGDTLSKFVLIGHIPLAQITQTDTLLTATLADSYQWYFNGQPIQGATQQTYLPSQSGDYSVMITTAEGCSAISAYFAYVINGLNTITGADFSIYPNPANEYVIIKTNTPSDIRIMDINGRIIYRKYSTGPLSTVSLQGVPKGIYVITISNNTTLRTFKLLVE